MLIVLFFLLVVYTAIIYKKTLYILGPYVVVPSVFLLSTTVAVMNIDHWGDISLLTLFVILFSIIIFNLGALIARDKQIITRRHSETSICENRDSKVITLIAIIFMSIITLLQYIDMVNFVGKAGVGLLALSKLTRDKYYTDEMTIDHSFFVWQGIYLCKALAYVYIYIISYKKIYFNQDIKFIYLIPIILYIVQILLSTGRSEFIYLIYSMLVIPYLISKSRNKWQKVSDIKYIKYILLGGSLFFFIFIFLANIRSEGSTNARETIGIYAGSSILAYDAYLNDNGIEATADYFGEQTMSLYYTIGRSLGLTKLSAKDALDIYVLDGEDTNIYTCLYRYTHDYGVMIMWVILFFIGYFYGTLYEKTRKNSDLTPWIVLFAYLSYPLTEFSIDERFFSNLVSARTLYICIYIILLFKYLIPLYLKRVLVKKY